MKRRPVMNVAASVRQRLLNQARERKLEYQLVLTHYAIEGLLRRLERSRHAPHFVLKGAMLYRTWEGVVPRVTRDLDLLGFGEPVPEAMVSAFREVVATRVEWDDGLVFDGSGIRGEEIRDHSEYRGVRLKIPARVGSAVITVQVDVGFGDVVSPDPLESAYPPLLDGPAPAVRAYPRETVVAEKFQAISTLSTANTRVKDYFDIWYLSQRYAFDGAALGEAVSRTFQRRDTALPGSLPPGLDDEFLGDHDRTRQWDAIVGPDRGSTGVLVPFSEAGHAIAAFVMPTVKDGFAGRWSPGGPWQEAGDA